MKPVLITSCYIAGFPHRGLPADSVAEGEEIILEPEPTNPHDPQAIKCIQKSTGACIGYVPREATAAIHEAISRGAELSTFIVEKFTTKWKEFNIHVRANFPVNG